MEKVVKKLFFTLLLIFTSLFAELSSEYPSMKIINSKVPIVDIRTPGEWRETGLLKGAIPIMFFDERGGYNVQAFLDELNKKVDTSKPFALICRTGSRTMMLSKFLSQEMHYKVIDLKGGMMMAKGQNLPIEPYNR